MSGVLVTGLRAWSAFDLDILDLADSIAINLFLVGGGLGITIFVGSIMHDPIVYVIWRGLLRYVVPAALLFILWYALPETWTKFSAVAGLG